MRRFLSRILYTLFFGFTLTFLVSCVLLLINSFSGVGRQLEAVSIDPQQTSTVYKRVGELDSLSAATQPEYNFGYQALTDSQERFVYLKLQRNLYYITDDLSDKGYYKTERVIVSGVEMPEASIRRAMNAYMADHPQVFWISNVFGYAYDSGNTVIECYSVVDAEECSRCSAQLASAAERFLSGINDNMTAFEKEKLLHDRLLDHCTYAEGISSVADGWEYFTIYGAMINGNAVCEGYSKAMQLLLNRVGVPGYILRGYADGLRHMWNLVQIDGAWYHLDLTWDDGADVINYEYFNLTTEMIGENHTIDPLVYTEGEDPDSPNFFLPECVYLTHNYYRVEGVMIHRFDNAADRRIVNRIVEAVRNGEGCIYLSFGPEQPYEDYINTLFNSPGYRIYHYIEAANAELPSRMQLSRDGMKMLKNENRRTVRIKLSIK